MSATEAKQESSVGHRPEGKWEFDASVTDVFEDMLRRSIPQYPVMRRSVFDLGCKFVTRGTAIIDMGASRGDAIKPFLDQFGAQNQYVAIEVSEPMVRVLDERFGGFVNSGIFRIWTDDLRHSFPAYRSSLVLSILTLQFTPIEYRLQILQRAHDAMVDGGAFIIVEKVLGGSALIDDAMVELYLTMKSENGYSEDDIAEKRKSLEGVLVPVTAHMNEELLAAVGFRQVDCFWRWMNFAGWVAVK